MLLMTLDYENETIFKRSYMGMETHSELLRHFRIYIQQTFLLMILLCMSYFLDNFV
jgi:hypothetical protein